MGDDNPTLPDVYKRQDLDRQEILGAIEKVGDKVQDGAIQGAKTEEQVKALGNRMTGLETSVNGRFKAQDGRIATVEGRLWKAASAGGATGTMAAIMLKVLFG